MVLTFEDVLSCKTPFCHLGIPQLIVSILTKKIIIFPGVIEEIAFSILLIVGVALTIGRGWCSWGCFWGGWEDGFSRIKKVPLIKKFNKNLLLLPFSVLLATIILSTLTLSAQYCWWLCPFKTISEFLEISTTKILIQTIIFFSLFLGLVVVLPILSKKRTQCSFLCPFGAMISFSNIISPFEVRIDTAKCIKCKKCINNCPIMAIDINNLHKETDIRCTNVEMYRCVPYKSNII